MHTHITNHIGGLTPKITIIWFACYIFLGAKSSEGFYNLCGKKKRVTKEMSMSKKYF